MLYCVKIYIEDISSIESLIFLHFQHLIFCKIQYNEFLSLIIGSLIFYRFLEARKPFSVLKLHFQHLIFAKIQYNEFLCLIIGFLQPYEQKFVDIIILILCKNIYRGYFIHRIFDFLPLSVLKLHFQHLIFAKIQYNEFLSLIIGFLQPNEQKFVDIMIPYCVKISLEDISSIGSLIFYRFPC